LENKRHSHTEAWERKIAYSFVIIYVYYVEQKGFRHVDAVRCPFTDHISVTSA